MGGGSINASPHAKNDCHFTDNIFKCIFMNEKFCILLKISLKFVPKGPVDSTPVLVQEMARRPTGKKPYNVDNNGIRYSVWVAGQLTHLPMQKMIAISQTTFSNAFSWMKSFVFCLKFHWSLYLRVQLTVRQCWFRKWLGVQQARSHYLNQFTDEYMQR